MRAFRAILWKEWVSLRPFALLLLALFIFGLFMVQATEYFDVYPFWEHTAVLEIELPDEGAPVSIPPQIRVLREVTADRRLKNAVLAQRIPDEHELLAETSEN